MCTERLPLSCETYLDHSLVNCWTEQQDGHVVAAGEHDQHVRGLRGDMQLLLRVNYVYECAHKKTHSPHQVGRWSNNVCLNSMDSLLVH